MNSEQSIGGIGNKIAKLTEKQRRLTDNQPQDLAPENEGEDEYEINEPDEDDDNGSAPETHSSNDSEEEDEDAIDELPEPIKQPPKFRKSVSAEAFGMYNKKGYFSARVVSKQDDTKTKIKERLLKSFMFQALEERDLSIVIDAMEEK